MLCCVFCKPAVLETVPASPVTMIVPEQEESQRQSLGVGGELSALVVPILTVSLSAIVATVIAIVVAKLVAKPLQVSICVESACL